LNNVSSSHPKPPSNQRSGMGLQDAHSRARASLRQALNRYTKQLRFTNRTPTGVEAQATVKRNVDRLSSALEKLDQGMIRVAVFGLVSRGKSAVLNALLEQKILQTGPLHGVTQYPRSVCWFPVVAGQTIPVELIDTPGLDEVGGQVRASIAREVADQADLILFVIAGDITRTEYQALAELQAIHKPLILVFNKIDLFPDYDRQTIYQKLQSLFARSGRDRPFLTADDIVMVAAEPAPIEVRVEYPDGQVEYEWETPAPQIEELRQKLLTIVQREGKTLLALNALRQARAAETVLAYTTVKLHHAEAEDLIWQFAKWKAIAIAANPIAVLDLLGGAMTDLLMIRSLAKLYGLPMTSYEAGKLLRTILLSSGGLLLGELGSGLLLGVGKSASAVAGSFDPTGLMAYGGAAIAQASLAGYGSYRVGKAAQVYLEQGCTWGAQGANTVIQDILQQVDSHTVIYRLRRELGQ
jgi:uncharacterized protein